MVANKVPLQTYHSAPKAYDNHLEDVYNPSKDCLTPTCTLMGHLPTARDELQSATTIMYVDKI